MNFKDLNLPEGKKSPVTVKVNDAISLEVRMYLPIAEKIALLNYVVDHALDENSGRFSPVRVELFYALAVAHWYADIVFEDDVLALDAYDRLECSGVLNRIIGAIPESEYKFMSDLVDTTTKDIADYNSSFAGILQLANSEAGGLSNQIDEILKKVNSREGLEFLSEMKNNVAGTD